MKIKREDKWKQGAVSKTREGAGLRAVSPRQAERLPVYIRRLGAHTGSGEIPGILPNLNTCVVPCEYPIHSKQSRTLMERLKTRLLRNGEIIFMMFPCLRARHPLPRSSVRLRAWTRRRIRGVVTADTITAWSQKEEGVSASRTH